MIIYIKFDVYRRCFYKTVICHFFCHKSIFVTLLVCHWVLQKSNL